MGIIGLVANLVMNDKIYWLISVRINQTRRPNI